MEVTAMKSYYKDFKTAKQVTNYLKRINLADFVDESYLENYVRIGDEFDFDGWIEQDED